MKKRIALSFAFASMVVFAGLPKLSFADSGAKPYVAASLDLNAYKLGLAKHIATTNTTLVYKERPQALLRSVVVLKYYVDADGNLAHSEILRSNQDPTTEGIALASLRSSAPFPKPAPELLQAGRVELSETWLFNNDGRFQLRTIALPQMDQ